MSATQIVERNVAARGGLAAWRAVGSMSVSGTMDLGAPALPTKKEIELAQRGSPAIKKSLADAGLRREALAAGGAQANGEPAKPVILPFALEMKRPHKTRLEIEFKDTKSVQIFDGEQGWKYRGFVSSPKPVPFNADEIKAAQAQQDLDGMLIDYTAKGSTVTFDKVEARNGRDQYKLAVTLKNGLQRTVWIDAKTFLETCVEPVRARGAGRPRVTETCYSDYRSVNGVLIPFVVDSHTVGTASRGKMQIESVRINPAIDDARFGKPG
jgi:outer membrane lipoprotein-sorting protein